MSKCSIGNVGDSLQGCARLATPVVFEDQAHVVAAAKNVVKAAEAAGDDATADLGIRRIQVHEKNSWMLASHLE